MTFAMIPVLYLLRQAHYTLHNSDRLRAFPGRSRSPGAQPNNCCDSAWAAI